MVEKLFGEEVLSIIALSTFMCRGIESSSKRVIRLFGVFASDVKRQRRAQLTDLCLPVSQVTLQLPDLILLHK